MAVPVCGEGFYCCRLRRGLFVGGSGAEVMSAGAGVELIFYPLDGFGEGSGGCGEFFSRPPDVTVVRHAVLTRNVLLVAGYGWSGSLVVFRTAVVLSAKPHYVLSS
jgi:hypothetical protein